MAFYDDSSLLRNHEVPLDVSETWEEEERFYRLGREHAPALLREVRISFDDEGDFYITYSSNAERYGVLIVLSNKNNISQHEAGVIVLALDQVTPGGLHDRESFDKLTKEMQQTYNAYVTVIKLERRLVALTSVSSKSPKLEKDEVRVWQTRMSLDPAKRLRLEVSTSEGKKLSASVNFPLLDGRLLEYDVKAIGDILHYLKPRSRMSIQQFLLLYLSLHETYNIVEIKQPDKTKSTFELNIYATSVNINAQLHPQVMNELEAYEKEEDEEEEI